MANPEVVVYVPTGILGKDLSRKNKRKSEDAKRLSDTEEGERVIRDGEIKTMIDLMVANGVIEENAEIVDVRVISNTTNVLISIDGKLFEVTADLSSLNLADDYTFSKG